jgi:hypothetical protein
MFNVYLDDLRQGPFNGQNSDVEFYKYWQTWIVCRSTSQVVDLLKAGLVDRLSLDHDLGDNMPTGYDLCKWMGDNNCWPKGDIVIHSSNPVGARNMKEYVDRYFYKKVL